MLTVTREWYKTTDITVTVCPGKPVPERQDQSGFTGARDCEW